MRPAPPPQNLTARERLAKALTLRLLKLAPYMTTWPQALALQAIPTAAPDALAQLARTCDVAWRFADDPGAEVHFEWYSKRVAVGGIYVAAEVRARASPPLPPVLTGHVSSLLPY
jgi:ubiquinone biosynthesis protein COQ9